MHFCAHLRNLREHFITQSYFCAHLRNLREPFFSDFPNLRSHQIEISLKFH